MQQAGAGHPGTLLHASFQLQGSEQGRQPVERPLGCSLLLACVFCHHILVPHGQQLSGSLSPFPNALRSFLHVESKLFWAPVDLKPRPMSRAIPYSSVPVVFTSPNWVNDSMASCAENQGSYFHHSQLSLSIAPGIGS